MGELADRLVKMAAVVVPKIFGVKVFPIRDKTGQGGASPDDGEIFFWSQSDDLVEIAVDGPGMNEMTAGELRGIGVHAGVFVKAYAVTDQLRIMIFLRATGQAGIEKILEQGFSLLKGAGAFYLVDEPGWQDLAQRDYRANEFCLRDAEDRLEAAGKELDGEEMVGGRVMPGHGRISYDKNIAIRRHEPGAVAGEELGHTLR